MRIQTCATISAFLALLISGTAFTISISKARKQSVLTAFIIVNERGGLSDLGLQQLDQLVDEQGQSNE